MAIDFYKLGRQSGAKTPKGQQSGFQSLVSSATKPIEDMLATSKAATAALTAAMPAGVPIEKVPEELRGQVTGFLTENKKAYTDATKVIASGINAQSERYKNAVDTINKVNAKFENLSGNLENIAVQRQASLDDPSYSGFTTDEDATTFSDLANGSLYNRMTVNEDGSFNYTDASNTSKAFKDFKIHKTGYLGQQGYLSMIENNAKFKVNSETTIPWGDMKENQSMQLDVLFNKLGPRGALDYAFSDKDFIEKYSKDKNISINDLKKNPVNVAEDFKKYNLEQIEEQYAKAPEYKKEEEGFKGTAAYYNYLDTKTKLENEIKTLNNRQSKTTKVGSKTRVSNPTTQDVMDFLKNKMGTKQFTYKKDEGTGGWSYYVKRDVLDANNKQIIADVKIQNAKTADLELVPLDFENIEQLLREAGALPNY